MIRPIGTLVLFGLLLQGLLQPLTQRITKKWVCVYDVQMRWPSSFRFVMQGSVCSVLASNKLRGLGWLVSA